MSIYHCLRHFSRHEFSAPDEMDSQLLVRLEWARHEADIPFKITSSFRAGDPGEHGKGRAVDIACTTPWQRYRILDALLSADFTRIGIYPSHIHADVGDKDPGTNVGPVIWYEGSYPAKEKGQ